jgi:hypothetical protein
MTKCIFALKKKLYLGKSVEGNMFVGTLPMNHLKDTNGIICMD